MYISIECKDCGEVVKFKLTHAIKSLINNSEEGSVFGGFICKGCGLLLDEEN